MPLKLGFIGAGNIIKNHAKAAKELGVDMTGVYDVVEPATAALAKEFNIPKTYTKLDELLANKDVNAVVIGTPNKFHAEQAIAALNAGKHVLLEKPMAMSGAEADAIVEAHKKSGKTLQMGMVNRFGGAVQVLKKAIDAGACGKLYTGQTYWYRRRGIPGFGGWFTTKAMSGGGGLIDIGVHMLDLALHLMSFPKPVAVSGQTYNTWSTLESYTYTSMWGKPTPNGKKDVDDYALALIRFEGGQTLNLNVSWAINVENMSPEQGVRLMGDKGGAELKSLDHAHLYSEAHGTLTDTKLHYTPTNGFLEEMKHFADSIATQREPMATAEQGRTVQKLLEAIYKSSEEGREIRL